MDQECQKNGHSQLTTIGRSPIISLSPPREWRQPLHATESKNDVPRISLLSTAKPAQDVLGLDYALWLGDAATFLKSLPAKPFFDLVVTSPPYNIGKSYERKDALQAYLDWQKGIIDEVIPRLKPTGSLCWQVGNFVDNGQIVPLDMEFGPIFKEHGLQMRNET
jgi:adenine-specific DNA-methyltransferase